MPDAEVYDPFAAGPYRVTVTDFVLDDAERRRRFPTTVWRPASAGAATTIVFSHHAGGHRRVSSFLALHLATHGYLVAALDHSEVSAPELAAPGEAEAAEAPEARAARVSAVVTSRVPDLQLLLSHLHVERAGAVGHSLGGWTVLAAAESDNRIASVVALAPGGSARPRPGVLHSPLHLTRPVPTLYLAGDSDVPIPVEHVHELAAAAPDPARLWVLRDADHQHFVDDVAGQHERLRALRLPGDAAWLTDAMLPIEKLCSAEEAHRFTRGLTLAHFDATLRAHDAAAAWLTELTEHTLAARGVHAFSVT